MADNDRLLKRTYWNDEKKAWELGGFAKLMYEWLSTQVPKNDQDDSMEKGYQLVGMLDPKNPSTDDIPKPPEWMTPEIMMQAACAWHAVPMQDILVGTGLVPLLRAKKDFGGNITIVAGVVDEDIITCNDGSAITEIIFNLDKMPEKYRLTENSTIMVQPISNTAASPLPDVKENNYTSSGVDYRGWTIEHNGEADIHIFV